MDSQKTWFITGASKGLGLSLVKQLLNAGQNVAATTRNINELTKSVDSPGATFLPLSVDLTNEESVADALKETSARFGSIDVVINNAGYGIGGSIEELTDEETRLSFDVNVFATLNVIRKALPYLRKQKSGHIINISSIAGIAPGTGWSVYAAAKYAVIGLSEVLADDVKSFGVKVTVVAPGAFRTSFLTPDSLVMTSNPIQEYQAVRDSHSRYLNMDGNQAGDPEKAAAAMIQIVAEENPPLYLLLGKDAYERAFKKMEVLTSEYEKWENLTKSTGFDD
ncbi:oxidoreductase [Dyadobacter sp. CY356]|uniref:oxidoreductase n=1 Tax=Dyadobacter sp. CY356 TaxID=2906442 RepID=UPI001F46A82E|nr:oxidoreductase [Dyadobacter sp. CY356]MCF0055975.1 oxidoreductase [Dyadobacter sp. CY356]